MLAKSSPLSNVPFHGSVLTQRYGRPVHNSEACFAGTHVLVSGPAVVGIEHADHFSMTVGPDLGNQAVHFLPAIDFEEDLVGKCRFKLHRDILVGNDHDVAIGLAQIPKRREDPLPVIVPQDPGPKIAVDPHIAADAIEKPDQAD